jgi:hypothetical protein
MLRAASFTAFPAMYVRRLAYAPWQYVVKSVSACEISTSSNGTPSSSAAIWHSAVVGPWPDSPSPHQISALPSSLTLIIAEPPS